MSFRHGLKRHRGGGRTKGFSSADSPVGQSRISIEYDLTLGQSRLQGIKSILRYERVIDVEGAQFRHGAQVPGPLIGNAGGIQA